MGDDDKRLPKLAWLTLLALPLPGWLAVAALWSTPAAGANAWSNRVVVASGVVAMAFAAGQQWSASVGPYGRRRQQVEMAIALGLCLFAMAVMVAPSAVAFAGIIAGLLLFALWSQTSPFATHLPMWQRRFAVLLTALVAIPASLALVRVLL